jgi:RNA polymerase sigma-70 factor, ECF subfamily
METGSDSTEGTANQLWHAGDHDGVARLVLSRYGGELFGFLLAQFSGRPADADEVFADFTEDFWRGLPGFQWRCSIRAWCYKLARSAASRYRSSPPNQTRRRVALDAGAGQLGALVDEVRTRTQLHLRTEVKDKVRELREQLSQADQDLLTLRIDRQLSWRDVVHAMSAGVEPLDEDEQRRQELALRQRFVEMKKRLRSLAISAGLLAG